MFRKLKTACASSQASYHKLHDALVQDSKAMATNAEAQKLSQVALSYKDYITIFRLHANAERLGQRADTLLPWQDSTDVDSRLHKILWALCLTAYSRRKNKTDSPKIHQPPGRLIRNAIGFCVTKRYREHVVDEVFADYQEELFEAMDSGSRWDQWKVRIYFYLTLVAMVPKQLSVSLGKILRWVFFGTGTAA